MPRFSFLRSVMKELKECTSGYEAGERCSLGMGAERRLRRKQRGGHWAAVGEHERKRSVIRGPQPGPKG